MYRLVLGWANGCFCCTSLCLCGGVHVFVWPMHVFVCGGVRVSRALLI